MKVAVFSTHKYDQNSFEEANHSFKHELTFLTASLEAATASLASGYPAVCVFVNDKLDAPALAQLARGGTKLVALRCAGFNNVDLKAAEAAGITVVRVPAYSPYAVAEFSVGLLLALDRKICRAWTRVREDNFSLEGLLGRDLHGKTVGVIGTGKIGALLARAYSSASAATCWRMTSSRSTGWRRSGSSTSGWKTSSGSPTSSACTAPSCPRRAT